MIKIRITWPMLFFGLIMLLIWLARDPVQPAPASAPRRTTPRPQRTAHRKVIDRTPRDTADLDHEAMCAAQAAANGPNPYETALQRLQRRSSRDYTRTRA